MASSNPFRKSAAITVDSATFSNHMASAATRFPALDSIETTAATPPPPTSFQQTDASTIDSKSKINKTVRVLSPPPLSPDPPEWTVTTPSLAQYTTNQQNEPGPFDAMTDDSDREMVAAAAPHYTTTGGQGPGNPFSKTLRDLDSPIAERKLEKERKEEGHALKAANTAKKSLDVNSFKRLLMTGNSESDKSSPKTRQSMPPPMRDGTDRPSVFRTTSHEDFSNVSVPRHELQEAPLISQEVSDSGEDDLGHESVSDSSASAPVGSRGSKKPPPPPSSRHGKSIKLDSVGNEPSSEALATLLPSDMNKPLPPAPVPRSLEEGSESPFDREAAGKLPETEVDVGTTSPEPSSNGRKAIPAPPPRRGHARGESKVHTSGLGLVQQQSMYNDENVSRASSTRSRPEHKRRDSQAGAPPPPPPRSHHSSRQSTQIPAGVILSLTDSGQPSSPAPYVDVDPSTTSTPSQLRQSSTLDLTPPRDSQPGSHQAGATRPWAPPPPPPPARNTSVRRPASIRSVDSSRRVSFESKPHNQIAPPPPPRRQRGSSRGSVDGPRRTSLDSVGKVGSSQVTEEEPEGVAATMGSGPISPQSADVPGKGFDILADLDALQREVDALRGKMG
ncbi:hypothetical protein FHETE_11227 [Fusarium heterosporum]|uniref:Uncharacterized protein n=1 Tax=Fusarium heterosporum TaxID=42747 RepID=A0A8H5WEB1_FUSHE|nr:hypothetical protein FHETE_11227 [Fusarium heterosporum]